MLAANRDIIAEPILRKDKHGTTSDLARSPTVDAAFMSNRDHPEWSDRHHWAAQHRQLGFSLHRFLAIVARDSVAVAPIFCRIVREQSITGNGFALLNELLRLHFPHVNGTHALSFDSTSAWKSFKDPARRYLIMSDASPCGCSPSNFIANLFVTKILKSLCGLLPVFLLDIHYFCHKSMLT